MADAFSMFNLPRRFELDVEALRQRFLSLSAQHHPDRFDDPIDQADAAERSSEINEAHQILSDPEKRAELLLTLKGGPAKSDDNSLPPDLLMEVMEVREEMEAALHEQDDAELARLKQWAILQKNNRLTQIGQTLDAQETLTPEAAARVRLELNALRYAQRMLDQMP